MKKVIALIILLAAALFGTPVCPRLGLAAPPDRPASETRRVAVVLSAPLRPYMEALKGLTATLAELHIHALQPITLPQDTQGDFRAVQAELLRLSADAYVSIGPEAVPIVDGASRTRGKPWVFTMVLDPRKLLSERSETPCGLSLTIPAAEQLQAILRTLPGRSRLGVFHSNPANRAFLQEAQAHARRLGLTLHPMAVDGPKAVPDRLQENLPFLDALWILPDPAIDSKALVEYVIETALFHNIPSIGYNRYFVEAGSAMAFVLDYGKIGSATALLLDMYLQTGRCPEAVPAFDVVVNENVLRRLLEHPKEDKR